INMNKNLPLALVILFAVTLNLPAQTTSTSLSATLRMQNRLLNTERFGKTPLVRNTGNEESTFSPVLKKSAAAPIANQVKSASSIRTFEAIGQTIYDLQTNNSIPRRIVSYPDGTISMVWTTSDDFGPNYTNRGTGWNYYDGNALLLSA